MVLFNYSTKELTAKIVYYGPGLCGKTTNLQFIHQNLPGDVRGKMLSLATKTDRTLFFDFLPIDLGSIRGMKTRVQLYTVPGQVFYNETRRLVLKGADGIVFVADSQETMLQANIESFRNLEENLKAHGMNLAEMPHVLQFNKRDLPKLSSIEELNAALNKYNAPFYESVATTGIGVQDSLKAIAKLVLMHLTNKYDPQARKRGAAAAVGRVQAPAPTPRSQTPPPQPDVQAPGPVPVQPRPAAASAATRAIPLSEIQPTPANRPVPAPAPAPAASAPQPPAVAAPPPPPDFHGRGPQEQPAIPQLGDDDIDDLMSEVEPVEPSVPATSPASEPLAAAPAEAEMPADLPAPPPPEPPAPPAFAEVAGPTATVEFAAPGPPPAPVAEPDPLPTPARPRSIGVESPFEVDEKFDPEWDTDPAEPAVTPANGGSAPLDEEPVVLTDEASDQDLFEDPDVEVARMESGQQTEIVVPVELGSGPDVRRFKLSIRLRLEPID